MTSCRTETETVSRMEKAAWTIRLLLQPSVGGVAVSLLVSGLTVDILSKFCGVFMVQYVKLMLRIFDFGVLLFDRLLFVADMQLVLNVLPGMGITQVRWKT